LTGDDEETETLRDCALKLAAGELPEGWEIVPGSPLSRVAFNARLQIYFKEFSVRSPLERLRARLLGGRASLARKRNEELRFVGIETPESIAWGPLPGGGEYLFMRAAVGQDIATWLKTALSDRAGDALASRRQLLAGLGVFVGRLHATGFIPGDLRPTNIVAERLEDRFRFTLINNENTVKKLPPPGRSLLNNLIQLNLLPSSALTRTDRMRFFVGWRRQLRELSPIEAKVLAAEAYLGAARQMAGGIIGAPR